MMAEQAAGKLFHPNEDGAALKVALLNKQTGITKSGHHDTTAQTKEAETTASGESQESQPLAQNAEIEKPKPPVETIKAPANYDILRVAANAAAKVYGWLTADKQPKKIKDQAPADYDVERVAANAAAKVYGWLPADKQPKKIKDQAPADYDVERVTANAEAKVYGWLPADKQPKKIKDQEAPKSVPTPPADYDVERVAAKAAHAVYDWLPKEQQPQLMDGLPTFYF
uniref:Ccl n=1 Tax=Globodera pallida TaxID=36090 RepID=A0A183CKI6_GLOPA